MLWRRENAHVRRPGVWSPGEYLVIDWAEAAPGLFVFGAVLAYSRWRFCGSPPIRKPPSPWR